VLKSSRESYSSAILVDFQRSGSSGGTKTDPLGRVLNPTSSQFRSYRFLPLLCDRFSVVTSVSGSDIQVSAAARFERIKPLLRFSRSPRGVRGQTWFRVFRTSKNPCNEV
jgi:hypothetical protein